MVNNKLLKTGGIYRLIYTTWKSQERPISFIIYSGPFKIHALNINSKKLSILDIKKFAFFIKKMKAIKGVEKYTGRVLYSILKKYFPDIVRKTYRTYTPSHVLGFSLVSTGIISPDLYTEYEKSYFNKFIYEQSKYDIALRTLNSDSKTGYVPPKKPNIYNPQPEVKIVTQKENINNIIKPELKIEKEIETKEPILPSNQGKNTDFFSIYDED
jgi:hypothetical protein